jgi:DNA-binding NtrC family response regulator
VKILVVDDESVQVESISRGLFLFGHEVVPALSSAEAEAVLRGSEGAEIDLLLTDMTMPGQSGLGLIDLAKEIRSDLPVVVITGLTTSPDVDEVKRRGIPVLGKPFAPDELDRTIRGIFADDGSQTV